MMNSLSPGAGRDLLCREGLLLDERRWEDWLALYTDDAVFWAPTWRNESELCEHPESELSLIYCAKKSVLADRIARLQSGQSAASTPLPRTSHAITNIVLNRGDEREAHYAASWTTHVFFPVRQTQQVFFGRCEHRLRAVDGVWRIAFKKVVLVDDYIPAMLDFYFL